ncbi:molybdopterin-dependent oxidoreductase, partial [Sediminimonas qiaohouensis]|uniref:molybdopterin-dependent oxidoreductase n=1 Tax=Sediminimonas qiaohouensis TaxID=552061 RepID=UPI000568C8B0
MPYTATHWGIREVVAAPGESPRLRPYRDDPFPNDLGLDQLSSHVQAARVQRPAVRESFLRKGAAAGGAGRGQERFVEVPWDEALDLAAGELDRVRSEHGNAAIFGGSYGWGSAGRFHHAQSQIHRFLNSIGGYVAHRNTYSLGAAHVILPRVVMPMGELMAEHTDWDTLARHTELFVTFGGIPAKNAQISAGGVQHHRLHGALRHMSKRGAAFVNVGPVGDNISPEVGADWIAIRPNTDTAFMLALAHVLAAEGLADAAFLETHCVGYERFQRYLTGEQDGVAKNPEWAAGITGAAPESIRDLARRMARSRTMVNMAWSLQRASHGEQPCWMLVTLAAMLGQIGLPGGGFGIGYGAVNSIGSDGARLPSPTLPQGQNPVEKFIPVARIADMLFEPGGSYDYDGARRVYPDIRLIYWAGGNPFHHHQDLNRLRRAWQRPETIIVNEPYWTATAKHADIVFPATIPLEREDIGYATLEKHMLWMAKVAPRHAEARDDYEIFTELARRLGDMEAFTEGRDATGWLEHMYDQTRNAMQRSNIELPDFETFQTAPPLSLNASSPKILLQAFRKDPVAAPLQTPSGKIEVFSDEIAAFRLDDCPGHPCWLEPVEWLGAAMAEPDTLHLLSDQPAHKLHSQLDQGAASQRGKKDGVERIRLNPQDAARQGLKDGSLVEVFNDRGTVLAVATPHPQVMPGVALLSTGAWYAPDAQGRDRSGNPNVLTLDRGTSRLAQGSSAQSCLVHMRSAE